MNAVYADAVVDRRVGVLGLGGAALLAQSPAAANKTLQQHNNMQQWHSKLNH